MDLRPRVRIRSCDGCSSRDRSVNASGYCGPRLQDSRSEVLREPTAFVRCTALDWCVNSCLQLFALGSLALACDELGKSAVAPGNLVAYHWPTVSRVLLLFAVVNGNAVS